MEPYLMGPITLGDGSELYCEHPQLWRDWVTHASKLLLDTDLPASEHARAVRTEVTRVTRAGHWGPRRGPEEFVDDVLRAHRLIAPTGALRTWSHGRWFGYALPLVVTLYGAAVAWGTLVAAAVAFSVGVAMLGVRALPAAAASSRSLATWWLPIVSVVLLGTTGTHAAIMSASAPFGAVFGFGTFAVSWFAAATWTQTGSPAARYTRCVRAKLAGQVAPIELHTTLDAAATTNSLRECAAAGTHPRVAADFLGREHGLTRGGWWWRNRSPVCAAAAALGVIVGVTSGLVL